MKSKGVVSWFNEKKGFGFINDESGEDIFVHYSEIQRKGFQTLEPGEAVSYVIVDEDRGKKATQVTVESESSL